MKVKKSVFVIYIINITYTEGSRKQWELSGEHSRNLLFVMRMIARSYKRVSG
jgi:hypothetical protein